MKDVFKNPPKKNEVNPELVKHLLEKHFDNAPESNV